MRSFSLLLSFLLLFAGSITFGAASPGRDDFQRAAHQPISLALKSSETVRIVRTAQQTSFPTAAQDMLAGHRGDSNSAALAAEERCRQFAARSFVSAARRDVFPVAHAIASPRAPPPPYGPLSAAA